MSIRRKTMGMLAAATAVASLTVAGAPVAVAAAPAGENAVTASVWRNIALTGTYTIRDDEGIFAAGTYCSGNVASEGWVNEVRTPSAWWETTCGGEIRVEKHVSAETDATGGVMIYVTLRFYEGTNDTNTDLDAEYNFNRYVPAGQTSTVSEITLRNGENGGKDWAKLNLVLHNDR
ncbi:hypothetical protein ACFFUA_08270 [Streptomyces heliomycini]|uniref:Secreted protein n=1 Tax=Streptomyces heliomycini TaxID=284032 RepID=A0ABV5L960_9ACTN|nr:hypothetical protein [Streptomyces sp. XY152]